MARRHMGPHLVDLPALGHIVLCLLKQMLRGFRMTLFQHGIARFIVDILLQRNRWRPGIELHGTLTLCIPAGIKAEERPMPGLDSELLLSQALGHIDAVRNAMSI